MDKNSIFTANEIAFLKALVKHQVAFMMVGLSAAALQGAPAVTQDIDLWFRDIADPNLMAAIKQVGAVLVPSVGLHPPMLGGDAVKLFDIVLTVHGVGSFDAEVAAALNIPLEDVVIKVLPLDRIISSKRFLGRDKDLQVLKVLEDTLKTQNSQA